MALYLVQHGRSLPAEKDPERGLSPEGIAEVERIAQVARGYNINVRQILHSGKERARGTAAIFEIALNPQKPMQAIEGLKPLDEVSEIVPVICAEPSPISFSPSSQFPSSGSNQDPEPRNPPDFFPSKHGNGSSQSSGSW